MTFWAFNGHLWSLLSGVVKGYQGMGEQVNLLVSPASLSFLLLLISGRSLNHLNVKPNLSAQPQDCARRESAAGNEVYKVFSDLDPKYWAASLTESQRLGKMEQCPCSVKCVSRRIVYT